MKWYYQHLPGETQDMDEVFENILIDTGDAIAFQNGQLGILWQLDDERQVYSCHGPRIPDHRPA